jgi:hypothetical protein
MTTYTSSKTSYDRFSWGALAVAVILWSALGVSLSLAASTMLVH